MSATLFDVGYEITQMLEADLPAVVELEEMTGLSRWGYEAYKIELFYNPMSIMRVARGLTERSRVLGFVASRVTFDELHINNIAVHPDFRRIRIASELLKTVIRQSYSYGSRRCLLEVRASNEPAQCLYRKLGFRVIGRRRDYYTQPTEDALVMQLIY
ncbi:MAG: ribosomal protein S18-alanine N-acetyltransferase [Acidobacteriota bacterium]|nr:ribosomal protein S18-alanine N-acetyltransferase [Blastocatellia bacterium]MDW8411367.1 ribosomal protein S18-alanine N-acetyltransferase [Acidobacteriota bacterium]